MLMMEEAHSQTSAGFPRDVFQFNQTFFPATRFSQNQGKAGAAYSEVLGVLPTISMGSSLEFFSVVSYRNTRLQFDEDLLKTVPFPKNMHEARFAPGFRIFIHPEWVFQIRPVLIFRAEENQPLSRKNFMPLTSFLFLYDPKGENHLRIGIGGGFEFFDFRFPRFRPVFQFRYQRNKMRYDIALPNAAVWYMVSKNLEFGLFSQMDNSITPIQPFRYQDQEASYLRIFQLTAAPTVSFRLYRNFFFNACLGGVAPLRSFRLLDEDFSVMKKFGFSPGTSLFFRVGISLRRFSSGNPG